MAFVAGDARRRRPAWALLEVACAQEFRCRGDRPETGEPPDPRYDRTAHGDAGSAMCVTRAVLSTIIGGMAFA
jgi:hypothetical protein